MNVSAPASTPATGPLAPAPAQLKVTLGWSGGNHLSWDNYTLNITRANAAALPTFDAAVAEARKLVAADTVPTPHFGKLSPVAGVMAVDDGFAAVRLVTANGFQIPIDGEVANRGGGGNLLQGVDVHAHGAVQALVGAESLLDLRQVPSASTAGFWRQDGSGGSSTIGPWRLSEITDPQPDPAPPTPPEEPDVPPSAPRERHTIATSNHATQYPEPDAAITLGDAISGHGSYASIDAAIAGAQHLLKQEKRDATTRSGPFGLRKNVGWVNAIAVMRDKDAFALFQTMGKAIDPYRFKSARTFFTHWVESSGEEHATRVDPKLEALVGWSRLGRFDSGNTTQLR